MNTKGTILIVDDVPTNLSVLMEFLDTAGYEVLVATDSESALEQAEYTLPDIILLDIMMPGMDGFETCRELKTRNTTKNIPIIFMSALSETVDKVRGFALGATDYIIKPLHQEEVVARVNAHLTVYRQKQEIERQKQEIEDLREQDRIAYENLSHLKDEMLKTASHDLKNPLTAILMSVDSLQQLLNAEDKKVQTRLNNIQTAANYMHELIINLLDLARLETKVEVQKAAVPVQQLFDTSISYIRPLAAANEVLLNTALPDREIMVYCNSFQIGQVLQNLISNAVKYNHRGGSVEISAHTHETFISVQVADTGMGIPEKAIPHLFEKFYRVNTSEHRAVIGTGLGLAIVQEIIDQHGGKVWVDSEVGVGSTFGFSLPRPK